jgi:hypothetical protein
MKKMDYTISWNAGSHTVTALSDRAKFRTPVPLVFAEHAEVKVFLNASRTEGFRFSGADTVAPEQKLVKNRYFIVGDAGQLIPCGEDWGPLETVWEVGDVIPGRETNTCTQAVVEQIIKGDMAQKMECGIAFILQLRNIAGLN